MKRERFDYEVVHTDRAKRGPLSHGIPAGQFVDRTQGTYRLSQESHASAVQLLLDSWIIAVWWASGLQRL
jgi:hypothetical protein